MFFTFRLCGPYLGQYISVFSGSYTVRKVFFLDIEHSLNHKKRMKIRGDTDCFVVTMHCNSFVTLSSQNKNSTVVHEN